jgi:hypothetical protein
MADSRVSLEFDCRYDRLMKDDCIAHMSWSIEALTKYARKWLCRHLTHWRQRDAINLTIDTKFIANPKT